MLLELEQNCNALEFSKYYVLDTLKARIAGGCVLGEHGSSCSLITDGTFSAIAALNDAP